ncbi:MAG: sarcosine oxidase, gamma subunit [Cupriavidus sp.]|nr:sarcosine oxidase, gamma subunit [Cupriavidus sp.]
MSAILMPPMTRFILRGDATMAALVGAAIELPLPMRPLTSNNADGMGAVWLGPDEWLLIMPVAARDHTANSVNAALAGFAYSLVEVSHRQVAFAIAGRLAARVLSSGCPLDLGLKSFPVGMVARTLFHKAEVVVWRREDHFHLEVNRSFAPYVVGHLAAAKTGAFGLPDAALP